MQHWILTGSKEDFLCLLHRSPTHQSWKTVNPGRGSAQWQRRAIAGAPTWGSLTAVQTLSLDTQHSLCGHLTAPDSTARCQCWGQALGAWSMQPFHCFDRKQVQLWGHLNCFSSYVEGRCRRASRRFIPVNDCTHRFPLLPFHFTFWLYSILSAHCTGLLPQSSHIHLVCVLNRLHRP